jgi:periplasmic protein CpxP/Spy
MKSFRSMALAATLLAGLSTVPAAQSTQPGADSGRHQHAEMRGGAMGGRGARALFKGIDLSDAQKQQLRAIREKYQPQMKAFRDKMHAQREQSGGERQRPDSATFAQMRDLMQRQQADIRAVLTPAQQKTFDANVAEMRQRGREMWQKRQGGSQGQN